MLNKLKNIIREFAILLKSNFLFYISSLIVMCTFLVMIGIIFDLQTKVFFQGRQIKQIYDGKNFYAIVDSLYNPDDFSRYGRDYTNINKIGHFYNKLSNSSFFTYLATYCQSIPIKNFKGDDKFSYNTEEFRKANPEMPLNAKSCQINQATYDFFKLQLAKGSDLKWDDIDYSSGEIPVILGSDYEGIYEIGEYFIGDYYAKDFKFVVKGFLKQNTFIQQRGNTEFYLDQYIIIPYPKQCKLVDASEFSFERRLYFSMINGDLVSDTDKKELVHEIKQISDETGFSEFSVIGLPEASIRYGELASVINENKKLVYISIILLLILIGFIQHGISRMILNRRKHVYRAHWLIGCSSYRKLFIYDISFPYICAFILAKIILSKYYQNINIVALFFTFCTTLFLFVISYISCRQILIKTVQ